MDCTRHLRTPRETRLDNGPSPPVIVVCKTEDSARTLTTISAWKVCSQVLGVISRLADDKDVGGFTLQEGMITLRMITEKTNTWMPGTCLTKKRTSVDLDLRTGGIPGTEEISKMKASDVFVMTVQMVEADRDVKELNRPLEDRLADKGYARASGKTSEITCTAREISAIGVMRPTEGMKAETGSRRATVNRTVTPHEAPGRRK